MTFTHACDRVRKIIKNVTAEAVANYGLIPLGFDHRRLVVIGQFS